MCIQFKNNTKINFQVGAFAKTLCFVTVNLVRTNKSKFIFAKTLPRTSETFWVQFTQTVITSLVSVEISSIIWGHKTSEPVDLLPLFTDDRKVFTVKAKHDSQQLI